MHPRDTSRGGSNSAEFPRDYSQLSPGLLPRQRALLDFDFYRVLSTLKGPATSSGGRKQAGNDSILSDTGNLPRYRILFSSNRLDQQNNTLLYATFRFIGESRLVPLTRSFSLYFVGLVAPIGFRNVGEISPRNVVTRWTMGRGSSKTREQKLRPAWS